VTATALPSAYLDEAIAEEEVNFTVERHRGREILEKSG
jgi:hypothetical protein